MMEVNDNMLSDFIFDISQYPTVVLICSTVNVLCVTVLCESLIQAGESDTATQLVVKVILHICL